MAIAATEKKRLKLERAITIAAVAGRSPSPIEKARKSRTIPPEVQLAVWRRDEGKCVVCGSNERLEFDHIIPFSRHGTNTERNVQLLCEACNRAKGNTIGFGYSTPPEKQASAQIAKEEKPIEPKTDPGVALVPCKHCKQILRIPRGKGTMNVKCYICSGQFTITV